MGRTILIFSDGTGQAGGLTPDQEVSNVYRLYRATRSDSDSSVDAREQIAFYDAGLGAEPEGLETLSRLWRRVRNVVAQALGLGINQNIVDCYAALVRHWRPGDRIFLVGFSRGAFTVRCLGGLLAYCGLPTTAPGGRGLLRDPKSAEAIAWEAVKIYQHGSAEARPDLKDPNLNDPKLAERLERAAAFRRTYGSGSPEPKGESNAAPYFIGVFDTVGTIANLGSLWLVAPAATVAVTSLICAFVFWPGSVANVFIAICALSALATAVCGMLVVESRHGKSQGWLSRLIARVPMLRPFRFYDTKLSDRVQFARHAVSIDENRYAFQIVLWDEDDSTKRMANEEARRMRQRWFAGVHSDIGGSYPEAESRLSDIALGWMADEMMKLPEPPQFAAGRLKLSPSPLGMQHDELKSGVRLRRGERPNIKGKLDDSVIERLKAPGVLHYDETRPYRPNGLRDHPDAADYYRAAESKAPAAPPAMI